jgi:preprotein translocase subunit SecA
MLKRYMGKLPLYEVMLRQFSARRDEFDDECDDFLLDEDDDKNENYNDYDGDDLFGWAEPQQPYVREQPKIGRNEPCPCGSGKKYKKCCGR